MRPGGLFFKRCGIRNVELEYMPCDKTVFGLENAVKSLPGRKVGTNLLKTTLQFLEEFLPWNFFERLLAM